MKKFLGVLIIILSFSFVGCSSSENVKDISTNEIKSAINNEQILKIQPISEIEAKDFFVFDKVKDNIKEGFVLQAMINVKLQDVFVVKTDNVEKIKLAIDEYKSSNVFKSFSDGYGGEENINSASNAILESVGEYVYFIAAPNAKDIENKLLEVIK